MSEIEPPTYIAKHVLLDYLEKNGFTGTAKALVRECPANTLKELNFVAATARNKDMRALGTAIHAAIDDATTKNPGDELIRRGDAIRACGSSRMRTMEALAKLPAYKRIIAPSDFTELERRVIEQLSYKPLTHGAIVSSLEIPAGTTITGVDMNTTGISDSSYVLRASDYSNINRITSAKENTVSESLAPIKVETITFVHLPGFTSRVDVKTLTPAQLAHAIQTFENKIRELQGISAQPQRLKDYIAELQRGLDALINAVDAADGVALTPKE